MPAPAVSFDPCIPFSAEPFYNGNAWLPAMTWAFRVRDWWHSR